MIRARTAAQGTDADNTEQTAKAISGALDQVLGAGQYTVARTEAVGPKVGAELRQKAFFAILLSFVAVLAYLAYRFEWRFGLAAVIATAHDILATLRFIALMRHRSEPRRRGARCCRWWDTRSTTPSSSSTGSARTCGRCAA